MGTAALTAWFTSQIGVRESGENNVRYNTAYYCREVSGAQYPWCMTFVWCGFHETGMGTVFLGGEKTAYCPYAVNWAKRNGRWVTGGYREGDAVFFDWDSDGLADHVGYVLNNQEGFVHIVEGNAGGAVKESHWREISLMGAYRPDYGEGEGVKEPVPLTIPLTSSESVKEPVQLTTLCFGSEGPAVISAQILLQVKWGMSVGSCGFDGEFGHDTEAAVRKLQRVRGLEEDGIVGPLTWRELIGR